MNLSDSLEILVRRKWILIITLMSVIVSISVGMLVISPIYRATSILHVVTVKSGGSDYLEYDLSYTERLMFTYIELSKSTPVVQELVEQLGLNGYRLPDIKTSVIPNTELLEISVEDPNPKVAMDTANALAQLIINYNNDLYPNVDVGTTLTLMEPATLPITPAKPNKPLLLLLGVLFGLVGGVGLAFVVENLDTVLHTSKQIENATELPLIGDIPRYKQTIQSGDEIIDNMLQSESFRRMRANISSAMLEFDSKSLLVTSPVPGDGKTTILCNLALSIVKTGRRVILLDADFRKPMLHSIFKVPNEEGLSNILVSQSDVEDVIQHTIHEGIDLITSGSIKKDPTDMLGSVTLQPLLTKLDEMYDFMMIDVAGCLSVADPTIIAPYVGGVLLVVRVDWVRRSALNYTLNSLSNVKANVIGLCVNNTSRGLGTSVDKHIVQNSE